MAKRKHGRQQLEHQRQKSRRRRRPHHPTIQPRIPANLLQGE
ncbi:hypothetical protein [Bifidobacterium parmae]|nr:hypothetical protein [Bifidobacterium parmae]